jgi:hypothetical protein
LDICVDIRCGVVERFNFWKVLMSDDNRHYEIIEFWIRNWIDTCKNMKALNVGDDSGEKPFGTKIIFNGFGENEDESQNKKMLNFAVFVHKDSLTKEFKEHETNPLALIHRPKEECCIYAWYDEEQDEVDVVTNIEDEKDNCTELDRNFVIDLIHKIAERDNH